MKRAIACLLLMMSAQAGAGPPYDTDDPVPTDTGHWEIYGFAAGEGLGRRFDGSAGLDLNYGPVKNVQLTATLPVDVARDRRLLLRGGNVELGVKMRLVDARGFALAIFPRAILSTGGGGKTGGLLPVWGQQTWGKTSLFGGGGYAIAPGPDGRDHLFGAIALTHEMSERLSLGIEATRSGSDAPDARPGTTLGLGGIRRIGGPFALLASAGPLFEDGSHTVHYHAYLALGVSF